MSPTPTRFGRRGRLRVDLGGLYGDGTASEPSAGDTSAGVEPALDDSAGATPAAGELVTSTPADPADAGADEPSSDEPAAPAPPG